MPNTMTIRGAQGDMLRSIYDQNQDDKADVVEAQISDLDHDAQKIKGVIIDDTAKADQKVLAYDLASQTIVYITQSGGVVIDSILHILLTIPSGQLSYSLTIAEVDLDQTFIINAGRLIDSHDAHRGMARIQLIDSTHIEATRHTANNKIEINLCLVKTTSGINSIQRGTIHLDHVLEQPLTISQVVTAKTFVSYLGAEAWVSGYASALARVYLFDSTTIKAKQSYYDNEIILSYEVVEFI